MYTIYINNTLPPALAVHEIYRDIFGPPMLLRTAISMNKSLYSYNKKPISATTSSLYLIDITVTF